MPYNLKALAKLNEAREQMLLLLEAGHANTPEFEEALQSIKDAIKEVKEVSE